MKPSFPVDSNPNCYVGFEEDREVFSKSGEERVGRGSDPASVSRIADC